MPDLRNDNPAAVTSIAGVILSVAKPFDPMAPSDDIKAIRERYYG